MQKKIKYLTPGAVLAVLLLVLIQLYFLRNTQRLYEKQSIAEIKEELAVIENIISINVLRKNLCENVVNMASTEADRNKLITALRNSYDSVLTVLIRERINANEKLKKRKVRYFVQITGLSVNFTGNSNSPIHLSNLEWIEGIPPRNAHYFANNSLTCSSEKGAANPVYVEYDSLTSFAIAGLNTWVFKKLAGLVIFSLFLFGCVAWLFYQSIKNTMLQKKIADMKTDFVNNITHEFKTPLASLDIATAALKKKGIPLDSESQEIIEMIERQSKRLHTLTRQAIEFSKSDAEISITKKEADITLLVKNILTDFRKLHPHIKINTKDVDKSISVLADAELLTTAVNNILDNAVKYGGTEINVEIGFSNGNCFIGIKDNGIGMSKENLKNIFDRFYRIETGDLHNSKGLGLGLYYASQVAKAHGGSITVESTPGHGSVFTIDIPVE